MLVCLVISLLGTIHFLVFSRGWLFWGVWWLTWVSSCGFDSIQLGIDSFVCYLYFLCVGISLDCLCFSRVNTTILKLGYKTIENP